MKESMENLQLSKKRGKNEVFENIKKRLGKSIKNYDLKTVIERNLKKYPGITEDQAAGREELTVDGKTGYLNGNGKLGFNNGDGNFITYEKIEKTIKMNMERYPGITGKQAAGDEELTINGRTGYLNGDGKLGFINGDGISITYEQLENTIKRNMQKYPGITEDQAAGQEEVTINGKTGYLNGDGKLVKIK